MRAWNGLKWLLYGLLVLSLLVLVAAGIYAQRSMPQTEGELKLLGLQAPVQVRRDESDVTHIQASDPLDAWMSIGYVHAQERGWQLEFNRRLMRGQLAEVLGPQALETDKLLRTLGIRPAAQRQLAGLPSEARHALQAYSDGINAFFADTSQARSPEFLMLGIDPEPLAKAGAYWDPADSVGWSLMMALDLGGNWGNELARLSALEVIDTEALWQLMPPYPGEAPAASIDLAKLYRDLGVYNTRPSTRNSAAPPAKGGQTWTGLRERLGADMQAWAEAVGHNEGKGSNNWLVSGTRSANSKPLLANDPHLGLSAPAIWYFARLHAPDAGGQPGMNAIGATLPGLPFVVLGRTAKAAWAFTNTGPDVQDLYLEQIHPERPDQYRLPDTNGKPAWAAFETHQEVFQIKGEPDQTHTVRHSRHGPVLSDAQAHLGQLIDTGRYALALRWSALEADNHNVLAGFLSNRAESVAELQQAYRHFHSPMQNILMADDSGAVAFKAAGKVPLRAPGNRVRGVAPVPGWDPVYDWVGWLAHEDTPADGGERGWIATANQRVHGSDYPHFLTSDWAAPYRQQRIETLLGATERHSLDSFAAMQGDLHSAATLRLLPYLQKARSQHPLAVEALAALQGFDGDMRAELAAPLIYTAWIDQFTRAVVGARLGQEKFERLYGKRLFREGVEGMLARNDTAWCGPGGCAAPVDAAFTRALDQLAASHGPTVANWRWGDAHPAISAHRPFGAVKPLAWLFDVRVPTGGDPFTLNVGQYHLDQEDAPYANRHAASLRALYDLDNLEASRFIYQTGQSGLVFSGRYRNMAEEWAAQTYRPLQMNPPRWRSSLLLTP